MVEFISYNLETMNLSCLNNAIDKLPEAKGIYLNQESRGSYFWKEVTKGKPSVSAFRALVYKNLITFEDNQTIKMLIDDIKDRQRGTLFSSRGICF